MGCNLYRGSYVKPGIARPPNTPSVRELKDGSKGTDVKAMQELLLQLEYSLPKYGSDGEFAVKPNPHSSSSSVRALPGRHLWQRNPSGTDTAVADDDNGKQPGNRRNLRLKPLPPRKCGSSAATARLTSAWATIVLSMAALPPSRMALPWSGLPLLKTAGMLLVNAQIGWVSGKYSTVEASSPRHSGLAPGCLFRFWRENTPSKQSTFLRTAKGQIAPHQVLN